MILLVDAEGPVASPPERHLSDRDGWEMDFAPANTVHLMVQSMETWIVADADALNDYYGNRFRRRVLPRTTELETVDRAVIADALKRAVLDTSKGTYQKIRDGGGLLGRLDSDVVRQACPSCATFLDALDAFIEGV